MNGIMICLYFYSTVVIMFVLEVFCVNMIWLDFPYKSRCHVQHSHQRGTVQCVPSLLDILPLVINSRIEL